MSNLKIKKVEVGTLSTNCYLIYDDKELLIVDPGAEGDRIVKEVEKLGVEPKYIINTHSHYDHTMANRYVANNTDVEILEDLQGGDEVVIGDSKLKVLKTPGHTKDSICLLGDDFLIAGDVLFEDGRGRTDLPGGSIDEMRETIEMLKNKLPKDMVVYPGHGEPFTVKDHYLLSGKKSV